MSENIKTNLKFNKSRNSNDGRLYGFVTKLSSGSWIGCRESDEKKKIVILTPELEKDIVPNALYSCTITPMKTKHGFIAISAKLVRFKGQVFSSCHRGRYVTKVKFGNKVYVYDPADKERSKHSIQDIAYILRHRIDLENAQAVAEDFISAASLVRRIYQQERANV